MSETKEGPGEHEEQRDVSAASDKIVIEHPERPEWLKRMMAADALEDFLGVPRGGHRDPSPGEARPRWPNP